MPFGDDLIFDAYTALDYKQVNGMGTVAGPWKLAPTWVGDHARRLSAYKLLTSYKDNASRRFLQFDITLDSTERAAQRDSATQRREYGDGALLIEQVRSALIGDRQVVTVEGAEDFDPEAEKIDPEQAAAAERQEFLQEWADKERLQLKVIETERNAVGLGDGVYTLGWDSRKNRLRLRSWDPGFYFPVIDEESGDDYPRRVHLAYELSDKEIAKRLGISEVEANGKTLVRRITWELQDVASYSVPWGDEPATEECFLTDGVWEVDLNRRDIDDFTDERASYKVVDGVTYKDLPLGIDFVPVVHVPNTVAGADHYGRSTLTSVLQLLDDIQATDTDLQASSAIHGTPMLAFSGTTTEGKIQVGPGEALDLGVDGDAKLLQPGDLSILQEYLEFLLRRLSVNARVPEAVLGRVDPSKIQAGVILALSFGPLTSLIEEMRLVRNEKYPLLLKFVQRFYMQHGDLQGPEMPASVVFGSYLPSDLQSTVTMVATLYQAKLISLPTAIKMLQEVGVPIDDPSEEEAEIDRRDYEGAQALLDATGNDEAVGERLGVEAKRPQEPDLRLNLGRPGGQQAPEQQQ